MLLDSCSYTVLALHSERFKQERTIPFIFKDIDFLHISVVLWWQMHQNLHFLNVFLEQRHNLQIQRLEKDEWLFVTLLSSFHFNGVHPSGTCFTFIFHLLSLCREENTTQTKEGTAPMRAFSHWQCRTIFFFNYAKTSIYGDSNWFAILMENFSFNNLYSVCFMRNVLAEYPVIILIHVNFLLLQGSNNKPWLFFSVLQIIQFSVWELNQKQTFTLKLHTSVFYMTHL